MQLNVHQGQDPRTKAAGDRVYFVGDTGQYFNTQEEAQRFAQGQQQFVDLQESLANPTVSPTDQGFAGEEFRTDPQIRAEGELASQLGVDRLSEVKPPATPTPTQVQQATIAASPDQFLDTSNKLLGATPTATAATAAPAIQVATPATLEAPQATASTIAGQAATVTAAQKAAPSQTVGDIQGQVSADAKAAAAQAELDPKATVTFQLEQLYQGLQPGEEPPAWASPAIRRVSSIMQARGLGSSSMAAAAITQGIMEAAIPIATADAQAYSQIQIANLSNKQQAALSNAATYAAMDTANLNSRMTAAVENSRAFLQIDAANLTNSQQANVLSAEAHNQFLLSDQAAENAINQNNIKTKAEYDKFFTQIGSQIQENNANRIATVEKLNTEQVNTLEMFNSKQSDLRDRFNAEMSSQIQASNTQWRRQITTLNNANNLEVSELNAQLLNDMSVREYNNEMLTYRDTANRIWQTSEKNEDRATQLAGAELAYSGRGSSGSSTSTALIGAAAKIGAALIACHTAQEVYGTKTNDWIKFRWWMYHQSPKWFKKSYMKYSRPFSKFIQNKPILKKVIKIFMDRQIKKVYWNV